MAGTAICATFRSSASCAICASIRFSKAPTKSCGSSSRAASSPTDMTVADLIAERRGRAGHLLLNRPKALNALTLDMTRALAAALRAWAMDPEIALVVIRSAGGRAFCAGGDVRALYEAGPGSPLTEIFYREEYALNRQIFRFPKPYVALIGGIV